jgi:diguanylate cyclase (GGDEF)-like protein
MLYSELSKLIGFYQQTQVQKDLKVKNVYLQNELGEKEKKLHNAEKSFKRKEYEIRNLVEASKEIYDILDYKQLINSSLLTIIGEVGFQAAFILMSDAFNRNYNQIFQKGFKNSEIDKVKFEMDAPLVKYFLKNRTPAYVIKLENIKELSDQCKIFKSLGIFLVAPIIHTERLKGIIGTSEKLFGKNFSQTDFDLFHILVNIISISIGNACLYEEVKKLSLTDAMTNLHNYRYFESRLKEEINRAKRNRSKISLLMLDIDHFKNYNDTLGHQSGDDALRKVGIILKSTVRDDDIVTRYGGEEFCIILPGISKRGMKTLGERIRKRIEKNPFYKEQVQPSGKLTVSLGGATFPDDGKDFDEMLMRADEALYLAKSMGRNQLRIFNNKKNK